MTGHDDDLFTPRSVRDARDGEVRGGDDLEARLRTALRTAPPVTADLQQVIRTGRAQGTRLRRRRRALTAAGTALAVAAVVAGVSVLLPRAADGGRMAGGTAPAAAPASGTPSTGAATAAAGGTAGAVRPVPPPAEVGGVEPLVPGQPGAPESIAVSADGRLLAISALGFLRGSQGEDRVRLFGLADPAAPTELGSVRVPGGTGVSVALSPDGARLAVAWSGGAVRLYDVADPAAPRLLRTLPATTARVTSVAFSPDGGLLAAGGYDDTVRLYRTAGSQAEPVATLRNGRGDILAVAFDGSGARLAAATYGRVTVWRLDRTGDRVAGTELARLADDSRQGQPDVAFAGDRLLVADGGLQVWDLAAAGGPRPVAALDGTGSTVAVSPVGDLVATQRSFERPDRTITAEVTLWTLPAGGPPQRLRVVRTPIGLEGQDRGLAWLPDGSAVYATTSNGGADLVAAR